MTTGKTISLTICTFVGKVMCLLFNMLSMFVMVFLPRGHHLLILWLQLASTVILEPKKIKSVTGSTFSSSICHEVMGPDAIIVGRRHNVYKCLKVQVEKAFSLLKKAGGEGDDRG